MSGAQRFDELLDRLVASYDEGKAIDNLDSAAMPSRRAVIEAFHGLQQVLFMGFYSTTPLCRVTLRASIAARLAPAVEAMVQQIGRAVSYADRQRPEAERRGQAWSDHTVGKLLARLPELRERLEGDVQAAWANDPAADSVEEVVFSYPGIRAITAQRVAHALYLQEVPLIPRILTEHAHSLTGIDLHPGASIGRRFFIDHGTGVVVGATTRIGDDVKLYQGVTLGALSIRRSDQAPGDFSPKQRHPTLEDRVTVYANATILGGDTVIGAGSVIGGNSFITSSVAPGSRVTHRDDGR